MPEPLCQVGNHSLTNLGYRPGMEASSTISNREAAPGIGATVPQILLTEDDEDVREVVADVLRDAGYAVDEVASVREALDRLDGGSAYALLLTDGRLPDGDGFTVADKAHPLGIKVLVYTGYADDYSQDQRARYTVLNKPLEIDDLIRAVGAAIASR